MTRALTRAHSVLLRRRACSTFRRLGLEVLAVARGPHFFARARSGEPWSQRDGEAWENDQLPLEARWDPEKLTFEIAQGAEARDLSGQQQDVAVGAVVHLEFVAVSTCRP